MESKMEIVRKLRGEKGVSAVEFAIVLPLLVLLVFGTIEFGVLLYDQAVITNASREGARAGIVFSDPRMSDGMIAGTVSDYCSDHLITFDDSSGITTTVAPAWPGRATSSSGELLRVTVQYHYDFLVVPAFIADLTGGIDLTAETAMRME
jgi:Flp pilus assembly protein TadG